MIDKAEIERIIDDLETKSKERDMKQSVEAYDSGYSDGLDYAIDRLKELI